MYRYGLRHPVWLETLITCFLLFLVVVSVLHVLIAAFAPRGEDGASELWGHELRIVTTDSMEECDETDVSAFDIKSIPSNSMIFVEKTPEDEALAHEWYAGLKVGDVLTVRYTYVHQMTITHRITSIEEKEDGGYIIKLAGDNKASDETTLYQTIDTSDKTSTNYVIGRVKGQSRFLGSIIGPLQKFVVFAVDE